MSLTIKKNKQIDSSILGQAITYNVEVFSGAYLYIDYTKGAEADLTLTFKCKDKTHPDPTLFNILAGGAIHSVVVLPGQTIVPIPVPESADLLEVTFTLGAGANATEVIEVFCNGDRR